MIPYVWSMNKNQLILKNDSDYLDLLLKLRTRIKFKDLKNFSDFKNQILNLIDRSITHM